MRARTHIHTHTHTHTHTPKPVCVHHIILLLRARGVHTNEEVTVNGPGVKIKTKRGNLHDNRRGNISGQE